jgi:hypothetical protein
VIGHSFTAITDAIGNLVLAVELSVAPEARDFARLERPQTLLLTNFSDCFGNAFTAFISIPIDAP